MNKNNKIIIVQALALLGYFVGNAYAAEDRLSDPSALIKIAKVVHKQFIDTTTVYGTIKTDPAHTHTVSAPRELNIESVAVRPGQSVKTGDALIVIQNSLNGETLYQQAKTAVQFAQKDLERNLNLFKDQLATRDQVAQAEKALLDAKSQLAQFGQSGAGQKSEILKAQFDGVVSDITAKPGDFLQAGAPILTIGEQGNRVVMLGLDPVTAKKVKMGAHVLLYSPADPETKYESTVQSVAGTIDPTTRLVNAFIILNKQTTDNLFIGNVLKAEVDLSSSEADTIPRSALMEDEEGTYVYTVDKDVAHKTPVKILKENNEEAALADLPAGTSVVISGNSSLDDGVHVREEDAKADTKEEPKP